MIDLDKLMAVLDSQREKGIKSGDWMRVDDYRVEDHGSEICLIIDTVKVGFAFTPNGRFKGIFNWK